MHKVTKEEVAAAPHEKCPLYRYCLTQKHENDTCDYMLRKYNAGLLLPPEYKEEENEQSSISINSAEKV